MFLSCFIDIYSKYALVSPLKYITTTNVYQKILKEPNSKPKKIWLDKDSEFYNRLMKSWLEKNAIEFIQHIIKENLFLLKKIIRNLKNS